MNPDQFAEWLRAYGLAWNLCDAVKMVELFAEDAIFQADPFGETLRGREPIRLYWTEVMAVQTNVEYAFEVLTVTPNMGINQWWATFAAAEPSVTIQLDGIAVVNLNSKGLCLTYHQWWHSLETAAEA